MQWLLVYTEVVYYKLRSLFNALLQLYVICPWGNVQEGANSSA